MKIIESNCQTGVVTERDAIPKEVADARVAWLAEYIEELG